MNKIIKALVEQRFGKDTDNVLEIISATPNTIVATEILLGLYEEPKFNHTSKIAENAKFISYDKWKDSVEYSYTSPVTKSDYFPKGTIKEDVTIDNFDELKVDGSKDAVWLRVRTGEVETRTNSTHADRWNKGQ